MTVADHDAPYVPQDPEVDVIRGRAAARLRADPDLNRILDTRERESITRWKASTSPEARDAYWYEVKAIEALRGALRAEEDAGKKAAHEIAALNARR